MSTRVWIEPPGQKGELFYIEADRQFADLVERYLGHEAGDYIRDMADKSESKVDCNGECDKLYEEQEYYENEIDEAIESLKALLSHRTVSSDRLIPIIGQLTNAKN